MVEKKEEVPGGFKVGGDSRRHKLTGGSVTRPYVEGEDDGAGQQLRDMRHVYRNAGKWDRTQGQKTARSLLKKDPKGFMAQLAALEKDHRMVRGPEVGKVEGPKDAGTAAALALCESWLKERKHD